MRFPLLLTGLALGCQGSEEPSCAAMAAHVVTLLGNDVEAHELRSMFENRCVSDHWSQAMRQCVKSTTSTSTSQNCRNYLNDRQVANYDRDLAAAASLAAKALPGACIAYETLVKRAASCESLPREVRDDLAKRLVEHKAIWTAMDDKSPLEGTCGAAIQSLRGAAPDCFK